MKMSGWATLPLRCRAGVAATQLAFELTARRSALSYPHSGSRCRRRRVLVRFSSLTLAIIAYLLLLAAPAFAQAPVIFFRPGPGATLQPAPDGSVNLVAISDGHRVDFYAGTKNLGPGQASTTPGSIPPAFAILVPQGAQQVSLLWFPKVKKPTAFTLTAVACYYLTVCDRKGDAMATSSLNGVTVLP